MKDALLGAPVPRPADASPPPAEEAYLRNLLERTVAARGRREPPAEPEAASGFARTGLGATAEGERHGDAHSFSRRPATSAGREPRATSEGWRTATSRRVMLPSGAASDRELWSAVNRLLSSGRERTALDLLGRFVDACPDDLALAARLAELLCERLEYARARPILERLAASPAHELRARFLLSEAAEREGDESGARAQLEAILAVDLDYPQARARADRLGQKRARPVTRASEPTLAGVPDGAEFGGRYRLMRELGRGGSGAVYIAYDTQLDRDLALKIFHPQGRRSQRADARARAWLEARVAAAIRHPGVIAIYDLDEERNLLAMELCAGGSLKQRLSGGPLAPRLALEVAAELLGTLGAVHRSGVVHGDVKPANLLFRGAPGQPGDLVLADFGVARLTAAQPPAEEAAGQGTLAYMAPEQRRGALLPACDVYAAGVLLLEMLGGAAVIDSLIGDRAALLLGRARWNGELPPAAEHALGAGRSRFASLAHRLLDEDPDERPLALDAAAELRALAGTL